MIDDLSGPSDDDDGRPQPSPALMLAAPRGPRLLRLTEEMFRMSDISGCNEVPFTIIDDETGVESWEPAPRGKIGEGEKYKVLMSWPTIPTIDEVNAFISNAQARRLAEWWPKLAEAKRLDDLLGYDGADLEAVQIPNVPDKPEPFEP
jgi:hypothetical protein